MQFPEFVVVMNMGEWMSGDSVRDLYLFLAILSSTRLLWSFISLQASELICLGSCQIKSYSIDLRWQINQPQRRGFGTLRFTASQWNALGTPRFTHDKSTVVRGTIFFVCSMRFIVLLLTSFHASFLATVLGDELLPLGYDLVFQEIIWIWLLPSVLILYSPACHVTCCGRYCGMRFQYCGMNRFALRQKGKKRS